MNKELQIVAWNVCDRLNDPLVQAEIIDAEPDIAVMPEARAEEDSLEHATVLRFKNSGYEIWDTNYEDDDWRKDRHGLVVIAKPEHVKEANPVYLAGRYAISLKLRAESETQFLGVHFDDRTEKRRAQMATEALGVLARTAILAGDFNAMRRHSQQARRLRRFQWIAAVLPSQDPVPGQKTPPLQRVGSLLQRVTQMADGGTMRVFTSDRFRDVDQNDTPTIKKGPLSVAIDHILYRGNIEVASATAVHEAQNLSDHYLISAGLRVDY